MQVKAPLPPVSPVTSHSCLTFCKTDFTATKHPPCSHSPSLHPWQHFNTRARLLASPNFSLAKYLSLHPATKLCQVPQAPRPPSCADTNGTVRSGTYISGNRTYVRSLIHLHSPPLHPRCLPSTHNPCPRTTHHLACTNPAAHTLLLQRGSCVHTEQSDLGTDFFPCWMGCHGDGVLCIAFRPAAGSNSRQRGTATHPCPMLLTQQHHKLHQYLLKHSLPS